MDGSQAATVALGQRITEPAMATMDTFEDRLRAYDQYKDRYERLANQTVAELAYIHLPKMIPLEARPK